MIIIGDRKLKKARFKNYKEIFRLREMLIEENIPFKFKKHRRFIYGYQIMIFDKNKQLLCDCLQCYLSKGAEYDQLEIMGGLTEKEEENDNVLGYLTAEEVFKRFKYCYEHSSVLYVEQE